MTAAGLDLLDRDALEDALAAAYAFAAELERHLAALDVQARRGALQLIQGGAALSGARGGGAR